MISEMVMAEVMAFMKSRVILTAAELDLFTNLDDEPQTAADLAHKQSPISSSNTDS